MASLRGKLEDSQGEGGAYETPLEKQRKARQVIEDFNRNNYLMAQGVPSEIQILENMPTLDYFTHFYNWLDQNERSNRNNF